MATTHRLALAAALLLLSPPARAIINPNFTPKDLVEESALIVVGRLQPAAGADGWTFAVDRALKGQAPKTYTLSLAGCKKDDVGTIRDLLKQNGREPVVLFAGNMQGEKRAYLHASGGWLAVARAEKALWRVAEFAPHMGGTLAGGTDMLIRMSEYLVRDPDGEVPITAGVQWAERVKVGAIAGRCAGLASVEIGKKRRIHLFAASPNGDRLFSVATNDELETTFKDVTAASRLDTKSRCFAWVDVDRDGLADLVSWDGAALGVRLAAPDGAFKPAGAGWSVQLEAGCTGLTACSTDGTPGLLVSRRDVPLRLIARAGKGWERVALPAGPPVDPAAPAIAADLNADGWGDVLLPGVQESVLWKGKPGGFHKGVKLALAAGPDALKAVLGDFNEDGALDLFVAGSRQNTLWERQPNGAFKNVFRYGGSVSYKCPAGAAEARSMDLNHDGRTDLCLIYPRGDIIYHFNRGFRCFGEEGEVRLPGLEAKDAGMEHRRPGLVAMTVGDYDEAGSQDLVVLLTTGEIYCYLNEGMDAPGARLRLPKGRTGPVTVSCWQGEKSPACIGMAVVSGHSPHAYVAARHPGELTVKWHAPGKGEQRKKVIVRDGPLDVILEVKTR